jgi:single-strand DNA-binding protein
MNQVNLVGRLGSDPEIKYTQSGQPVANFSLAIDESYKNKSGEKINKVLWVRCVAWTQTAETMGKYLHKGDQVILTGRLQTREYDAKDGSGKRYITEVVVNHFEFGAKKGAPAQHDADTGGGGTDRAAASEGPPNDMHAVVGDDDIPF